MEKVNKKYTEILESLVDIMNNHYNHSFSIPYMYSAEITKVNIHANHNNLTYVFDVVYIYCKSCNYNLTIGISINETFAYVSLDAIFIFYLQNITIPNNVVIKEYFNKNLLKIQNCNELIVSQILE